MRFITNSNNKLTFSIRSKLTKQPLAGIHQSHTSSSIHLLSLEYQFALFQLSCLINYEEVQLNFRVTSNMIQTAIGTVFLKAKRRVAVFTPKHAKNCCYCAKDYRVSSENKSTSSPLNHRRCKRIMSQYNRQAICRQYDAGRDENHRLYENTTRFTVS